MINIVFKLIKLKGQKKSLFLHLHLNKTSDSEHSVECIELFFFKIQIQEK